MSMPPVRPRRSGRPADKAKRDAILAAAAAAFFEHGYAAASIEGIAAAAKVSKVTVYNHFSDKGGLFTAAVERECAEVASLLAFDGDHRLIRDRLIAFGRAMHAFLGQSKIVQFDRRIAAEAERDPELGRMFLEAGPKRMLSGLAELLRHADQRGELRIDDPALGAELFAGMVKGIADMERRFGGDVLQAELEKRVELAVEVFLCYFSTPSD